MKRARGRDREGFASTLPVWIVEDGTKKGTLHIECPRCGGKAVVSKKRWIDVSKNPGAMLKTYIGRSCTYCFFTNRLPKKWMNRATRNDYVRDEMA